MPAQKNAGVYKPRRRSHFKTDSIWIGLEIVVNSVQPFRVLHYQVDTCYKDGKARRDQKDIPACFSSTFCTFLNGLLLERLANIFGSF